MLVLFSPKLTDLNGFIFEDGTSGTTLSCAIPSLRHLNEIRFFFSIKTNGHVEALQMLVNYCDYTADSNTICSTCLQSDEQSICQVCHNDDWLDTSDILQLLTTKA